MILFLTLLLLLFSVLTAFFAIDRLYIIKSSNDRLAALEAAGQGIGFIDVKGNLTYANLALWRLHGIPEEARDSYLGQPWSTLYTDEGKAHIRDVVMPILQSGGWWKGEAPILTYDGSVLVAEMTLTLLEDGSMVGTAHDITERKAAQQEKEMLLKQIFQAQKMEAIGRLAGGIAHDFNNILAAILGYAEFLCDDLKKETPQHQFAQNIVQSGLQARRVIDQILSFSRRNETVKKTVNLAQVLDETIIILRASLPKTIQTNIDITLSEAPVEGNHTHLAQMLMNLFVNAKDAMEDGHGALGISLGVLDVKKVVPASMISSDGLPSTTSPPIRIESVDPTHTRLFFSCISAAHHYIHLRVSDTGSGISRVVMDHIFEPFFSTKPLDKGTGLGMASVHGVLTQHQAAMIINSREGEGTCFDIFLPLAEDAIALDEPEDSTRAETGTGLGEILLIDDQDHVREMLTHMITRFGYSVRPMPSAVAALAHLREHADSVDLVVSDQTMPGMTGLELAAVLFEEMPDVPFVLISGYNTEDLEKIQERLTNLCAVLKKPVDRNLLSRTLEQVLR